MSKTSPSPFHCWQCGSELEDLSVPVPRYEACPYCRAELHVCRMCRHYHPKVIGECRHDRADRVEKKREANYCTFFRPHHNAHYLADAPAPAADSKQQLNELFGLPADTDTANSTDTPASLFDLDPPEQT